MNVADPLDTPIGPLLPRDDRSVPMLYRMLILVVVVFNLFVELGTYRTFTAHEVYIAVTAREMLQTGEWIVPHYAGEPRLQKPPLPYWIVAGLGKVVGEVTPFLARLPIVLASLAFAAMMGVWCARWYGRRCGWLAFLVQGSMGYVLYYGRRAEVDLLLCGVCAATMWLLIETPRRSAWRTQHNRYLLVWVLLACSWMLKFHYGSAMVLLPYGVSLLWRRRLRDLIHFLNPIGLTLFAVAVFAWPMLVLERLADAGTVWHRETVGRALGVFLYQPVWFYVPHLLTLTLPWLPFAAMTMPKAWRLAWRDGDERQRCLWCWLIVDFAIVSAQPDKHTNYLLAALPVLTLWAVPGFARWLDARPTLDALRYRRHRWMPIALGTAGCSLIGASLVIDHRFVRLVIAVSALTSLGVGIFWALMARQQFRPAAIWGTLLTMGVMKLVMGEVMPGRDPRIEQFRFVTEVREAEPDAEIVLGNTGADPIAFPLDQPMRRADDWRNLPTLVPEGTSKLVLTYDETSLPEDYEFDVVVTEPTESSQRVPLKLISVRRSTPPQTAQRTADDAESF